MSGDTIVVGAWGDDDAGIFSGSAYVFERDAGGANSWGEVAKLTASDAATAVAFELPASFEATVFFDLGDGDGEIDVVIFSSPVAALADGTLATVSFAATCTPLLGETVVVPVGFSPDPTASFGDTLGQDLAGSTADGSVEIYPGPRGDANGNGLVAAVDVSAVVLELFDGDGDFWLDTPGGSFPGSPVGSDSNADTAVDAGDLSCISRLIFGLPCGGGARAPAVTAGPWLSIPVHLPVSPENTVVVPVRFAAQGHDVNSVVFSLDFDQALLSFDPGDDDGDGIPDAVRWYAAGATLRSVTFDPGDVGGELDFVLADLSAAPDSLADGVLVEIELLPLISGSAIDDGVGFSHEPTDRGNRAEALRMSPICNAGVSADLALKIPCLSRTDQTSSRQPTSGTFGTLPTGCPPSAAADKARERVRARTSPMVR